MPLPSNTDSAPRFPDLRGKVVLVTGASSGIGAAAARLLGAQGARVALCARRADALDAVLADVRAAGGEGIAVPGDAARDDAARALVAAALGRWGRIDGAFNNAGTLGRGGPVEAQGDADYDAVFDVNVRAAVHALRHQVPALRAGGGGSLVFTASMAGTVGFAQAALYSASKHAVVGLVRSAALELGREGIRVNALCPGVVATPMSDAGFGSPEGRNRYVAATPAGRAGTPAEIAAVAAFLLSGASDFVNGAQILADGGFTAA
ncbi:SDR family NAD(P)-dependent oxidoreductase [Xylophilus sp.]|uniref:SDR family NAD(P)-dependent oxidoreductase n=1 Tax=Xylophilus sp. TaxID=2653893 RepID=UPI0013B9BA80|nr:SDR family oxidoreductase [Xylophilus sp.]KAF1042501.1 MAG: Levodione reductase [Xylophilus sp.]